MPRADVAHAWQLVPVAEEQQDGDPFSSMPNCQQKLEGGPVKKGELIDEHNVIGLHRRQTFVTRAKQLES